MTQRRLIEAGAGRRPPARTTEEIRQSITFPKQGPEWLRTLKMRFGHHLSNGVTRKEMAELYEKALSETLQYYDDLQQRVWQLEKERDRLRAEVDTYANRARRMSKKASRAGKRLWAVLDLLEQRFDQAVNIDDGEYPTNMEGF